MIVSLKKLFRFILIKFLLLQAIFIKKKQPHHTKRLVLLISRVPDVDLLHPIYERVQGIPDLEVETWILKKVLRRYPSVEKILKERRQPINFIVSYSNMGVALSKLTEIDALLNTVESSYSKQKIPSWLVQLANALGICTYTMQHGFENIGLTWIGTEFPKNIYFFAKEIFTWGPVEHLTSATPATRQKSIGVGVTNLEIKDGYQYELAIQKGIIGIFENLHFRRFDDNYIKCFFENLSKIADEFSQFNFLIKPHPVIAKRITPLHKTKLEELSEKNNIQVLDPADSKLTNMLLRTSLSIITTPSTIALDAALVGIPVAVVRNKDTLPYEKLYNPLPLLDTYTDWSDFLNGVLKYPDKYFQLNSKFLNRVIIPGDAAKRIITKVINDISKTSYTNP